jgi:hypothetical protein
MKAGNTLDTLITEDGRARVRHYLQDVGSTFGTGANAPREYFEGWEYVYEHDLAWRRLLTLGFFLQPWQTIAYDESPAIGRFEGERFDPREWKSRVPTAAVRHAQPDDLFWAARRVAAFSDEMLRAIAGSAGYSNPDDTRHLAGTLMQRRDKIAAAYLTAMTPLVDFKLADGQLTFVNAAVRPGIDAQPRGGYDVSWAYFDNTEGTLTPVENSSITRVDRADAPPLRDAAGTIVRARVRPIDPPSDTWKPLDVYFRRGGERWILVGLDREGQANR